MSGRNNEEIVEGLANEDEEFLKKYPYVKLQLKKWIKSKPDRPNCIHKFPDGSPCLRYQVWDRLENKPLSDYCKTHATNFELIPSDKYDYGKRHVEATLVNVIKRILPEYAIRDIVNADWTRLRSGLIRHLKSVDARLEDARRKERVEVERWKAIKEGDK